MTILSAESTARSLTCDEVLTRGTIKAAVRSCDVRSSRPPTTLSVVFDPSATLLLSNMGDIPTRTYSHIAYHLRATAIQIRWASSDVSQNTPSSTAVVSLTGPGTAGLSSGARIGIGVGVTLACLLLIGLLVFFILLHRRRNLHSKAGSQSASRARQNAPGFYPAGIVIQPGSGHQR